MIRESKKRATCSNGRTQVRRADAAQAGTHRIPAGQQMRCLRAVLDASPDAIFFIDRASMKLVEVNRAACCSLGYSREQLLGMGACSIWPGVTPEELEAEFDRALCGESQGRPLPASHRRSSGQEFPVDWHVNGVRTERGPLLVVVAREVGGVSSTGLRGGSGYTATQSEIACDPLTGLPGRPAFERRLRQTLERARRKPGRAFAVLFVDLDGFKAVNDRFGHSAGDRLLGEIGRRLAACLRPGDMVARRGGDEFTVLVDSLADWEDATGVAERIKAEVAVPLDVNGRRLAVTASIGIALSQRGYRRPDDMIDAADCAMYRAKALGKSGFAFYGEVAQPPQAGR